MTTDTKSAALSLRMTARERADLDNVATLSGNTAGGLAAVFVSEGVRRARFPAIEFRDGQPGRVAYLTGSRWPVWMIVQLAEECGGDLAAVAAHMHKPPALVRMALAYAKAYPEEIEASLRLHAELTLENLQRKYPAIEAL